MEERHCSKPEEGSHGRGGYNSVVPLGMCSTEMPVMERELQIPQPDRHWES